MTTPLPTIRGLHARPVNVPLARPLHTGGGVVATAPLVLIDVLTEEGITGRAYVFVYTPLALRPVVALLTGLADTLKGQPVAPFVIERALQKRFRLLGPQGLTGIALAGIDMALWDALAVAAGLPLVRLLGGAPRPVPAYNSCGLGLVGVERAAVEAPELARGFSAIKVRLGYATLAEDVDVVRAVRGAVGGSVRLMADYNQSLTVPDAVRRLRTLDAEGLEWVEEPTRAEDATGHAHISREVHTPIQLGENWWGTADMAKSLAAGASDLVMPDAMKIGGITGWLRAAALAEATGLPLSSHLFPEISAHLMAVTPTAHWLEYVEFSNPVLETPLEIRDGHAIIPDRPGIGLSWNEGAVERFLVG